MPFGEKLKTLRKQSAISQDKLGEEVGVHGRHIGKYERGSVLPNAETLMSIATFFNVSVDYLLFDRSEIAEKPDMQDSELGRQFEAVKKMKPERKQIVIELIDAFIKKYMLEDIMKK